LRAKDERRCSGSFKEGSPKLENGGSKAVESDRLTFADLAEYCAKEIYVNAEYNETGEKQSGVRDFSVYKAHLKHLKEFFKGTLVRDITVAHLKRYRSHRLSCKRVAIVEKDGQKEKVEKTISPSSVSRELNTLRAMLYEAKRNKWIQENPFFGETGPDAALKLMGMI
jgi:Phage integrase SAM-like domain